MDLNLHVVSLGNFGLKALLACGRGRGWMARYQSSGPRGDPKEVCMQTIIQGTVLKGVRHLTWHLPMSPPPPAVGPFLALLLGLGH